MTQDREKVGNLNNEREKLGEDLIIWGEVQSKWESTEVEKVWKKWEDTIKGSINGQNESTIFFWMFNKLCVPRINQGLSGHFCQHVGCLHKPDGLLLQKITNLLQTQQVTWKRLYHVHEAHMCMHE